jgi:hypothetical protein
MSSITPSGVDIKRLCSPIFNLYCGSLSKSTRENPSKVTDSTGILSKPSFCETKPAPITKVPLVHGQLISLVGQ